MFKKTKSACICYHYDSPFQGCFSKKYTRFKIKWLINEPLKQKTDLILKQIESFWMLDIDWLPGVKRHFLEILILILILPSTEYRLICYWY